MNQFRFDKFQQRSRIRFPRPILYVGAAIILVAFFSIKTFQRAGEAEAPLPVPAPVTVPDTAAVDEVVTVPVPEETGEGILALDGEGPRLQPPQRLSGERPQIPSALLAGRSLEPPRVYVRVNRNGLVTDTRLVSSSGSDEVDRLVLEALGHYTFQPAVTAGRTVEFASVVTVPLTPSPEPASAPGQGR